ncbi:hypothetical protein IAD21_04076 [Abditibacteriota bacterium]|nr:hypothetical protein IAD21_04076 [Abditibacteriota bacterium]
MHSRSSSFSSLKRGILFCCLLTAGPGAKNFAMAQTREEVFAPTPLQKFDGRSDWSRTGLTTLPTGGNAPWTINMFVKPEVALYELTLIGGFGNARDGQGTQRYIGRIGDGIHFWGGGIDVESDVPFDVGGWQMITAAFDGKTLTLYKNGQSIKTSPVTLMDAVSEIHLSPKETWPNQDQRQFNGRIQGFAVWNSALSTSDIQKLMTSMPER